MEINITNIPDDGKIFEGEDSASILGLDNDKNLRLESPIRYNLKVHLVSDELMVRGTLAVDVSFKCSKCCEFFNFAVSDYPLECFRDISDQNSESVDLTPDIREAIILAFPNYPVCSLDCIGLCSQCGIDLNKDKCDCRPPQDSRWSVLEDLSST